MNVSWDHDKILQLIDAYRSRPELWDIGNKYYHTKEKKYEAWCNIARELNIEVEMVRSKMNSLLSSFRREKARGTRSIDSEKGRIEVYVSKWFAFKSFSFMLNKKGSEDIHVNALDTDFFETKQEKLEPVSPGDIRIKDEFADSGVAVSTPHEELEQLLATAECSTAPRTKRLRTDGGDHWQADDPKLSAVLDILKKLSDRDDSGVYGEHVAMKMRSYSTETKSMVQHLINNVLFEADMGKFDNPFSAE